MCETTDIKTVLQLAAAMQKQLSNPEEYLVGMTAEEAFDSLTDDVNNASGVINILTHVIRQQASEGKEIRGFFGQYRFLSNFYEAPVDYDGIRFLNNEAAFQAQKCPERAAEFRLLNPSEAKRLGRHVKLRPDWENVKVQIMGEIVYAKFTQNEHLKTRLLDTWPARLFEENNWGDTCWGTVDGEGENHLGLILEDVRDYLSE